jgi:hypothetical protein
MAAAAAAPNRITVFEMSSRTVLGDLVSSWHDAVSPDSVDGICRLAQSFAQLSRDLGAGRELAISCL